MCSSTPAFKSTGVWNCPESCCTAQRQLCCPVVFLLDVGRRGETKVAFHSTVLLTSPLSYNLIVLLAHSFVFSRHSVEIMQHLVFTSWLFFASNTYLRFLHVVSRLDSSFFFLVLKAIPVSGYTIIYPSVYLLLKVILLASKFW